jgi:F0F1-type ATP synthase membrane subunit c/vacuolar-type H+-ATPase subunit K
LKPDEDPGWRPIFTRPSRLILPGAYLLDRRDRSLDGLTELRRIYLRLVLALAFFVVAFGFIESSKDEGSAASVWIVAAVGLACLGGLRLLWARSLLTSSAHELAGSYRSTFFMGIGLAETPAICGMAVSFVGRGLRDVILGVSFGLVGFWMIRPSKGELGRRQAEITAAGSPLSLVAALRGPAAGLE